MKTLLNLLLATLLVAGISSCRSYNYYTAGLNKTNMSRYRSFAWVAPQTNNKSPLSSVANQKVRDAAVASLSAKGLQLQQNDPDLLVTYTATVGLGSKTVYAPLYRGGYYGGLGYGWGPGWGWGWGYGWGWARPYWAYPGVGYYEPIDKEHYKEGTVIIDLIDNRTHKIVWRGFGVGEAHHNREKDVDDLPKVVDGIISQLQVTPRGIRS